MGGEQAGASAPNDQQQGAVPAWFAGGDGTQDTPKDNDADRLPPILIEDDAETAAAEADAAQGAEEVDTGHYLKLPAPRADRRPPAWAMIPQGMKFPKGLDVAFVRIRAEWTAAQHKGDRFLILWSLTDADERLAYQRANGDANRAVSELAKQMVRAIDGSIVDWTGRPGAVGNVDQLWRELGGKGRGQLVRLYTQMHTLDREAQQDFFENCVELVTTG